jgi:hypothetical protein
MLYAGQSGVGAPVGACVVQPGGTFYIDTAADELYYCKAGVWTKVNL